MTTDNGNKVDIHLNIKVNVADGQTDKQMHLMLNRLNPPDTWISFRRISTTDTFFIWHSLYDLVYSIHFIYKIRINLHILWIYIYKAMNWNEQIEIKCRKCCPFFKHSINQIKSRDWINSMIYIQIDKK